MNLNNSKTKICQSTRVPVSANNTITQKLKSYYAEKLKPTPATWARDKPCHRKLVPCRDALHCGLSFVCSRSRRNEKQTTDMESARTDPLPLNSPNINNSRNFQQQKTSQKLVRYLTQIIQCQSSLQQVKMHRLTILQKWPEVRTCRFWAEIWQCYKTECQTLAAKHSRLLALKLEKISTHLLTKIHR